MRRLRAGELMAGAGAVLLIVSLTRRWYETPAGNRSFWDTFGPAAALLLVALVGALVLVGAALTERESPAPAVASAVWGVLAGFIGTVAAVIRLLERPDHASSLCAGPWIAFAGVLLVLAGAWEVLRDERPSRYRPAAPDPRPRP